MGRGSSFTTYPSCQVQLTRLLMSGGTWMALSTTERGVLRKFEGVPGVFVQDSRHLHELMSTRDLPM